MTKIMRRVLIFPLAMLFLAPSGQPQKILLSGDPSCFKQSRVIITNQDEIRSITFSPDGEILAAGAIGDQGITELWEISSGTKIRAFERSSTSDLCFSPDGKILASASFTFDKISLWDPSTGQELNSLFGHGPISFSPDGKILVYKGEDRTIRFWEVASGKEIHIPIQKGPIGAISFSPDGKTLASSVTDNYGHYSAKLWDAFNLTEILTLPGTPPLCFSPDGKILAIGSNSYNIKLWDSSSGKEVRALKMGQFDIKSISFSPNGKWLAAADGMNIYIWEVSSGHLVKTLKSNKIDRWVVSFSPHGKWLDRGGCAEMPDQRCIKGAIMLWSC